MLHALVIFALAQFPQPPAQRPAETDRAVGGQDGSVSPAIEANTEASPGLRNHLCGLGGGQSREIVDVLRA